MATIDYIYFDTNNALPKPVNFMPEREDVYASEITTCTGKLIADRIGWKFADIKLEWGALTQAQINILVNMSGIHTLTFDDADGTHTENVIRKNAVSLRNRNTINGVTYWRDVSLELVFTDVHNN